MIFLLLGLAHAAELEGSVETFGVGAPIPGARVICVPPAEGKTPSPISAETDIRGKFTLQELPNDGEGCILSVNAAGYEPWTSNWTGQAKLNVYLKNGPKELEVVVESLRPAPHLSRHVVDHEQLRDTPGNYDDAVRLVQGLPGVAVQREFSPSAGDMAVRGSTPGQNRYLVDGIEIPYLYHFNQYASVLPSQQLQQLELYPSNFGVKYGDAVGAVIDAQTSSTAPEAVHGDAQLNFLMLGASVRAPIKKGWWFSASGRRSYQDLAGEQTLQYTVWPVFQDYAVRLQHKGSKSSTGLYSWGAADSYTRAAGELDVLDPLEAQQTPQFAYNESFSVHGLKHEWSNSKSNARIVGALVQHQREGVLDTGSFEELRSQTVSSRGDLSFTLTENGRLNTGWELRSGHTSLDALGSETDGILVGSEAPIIARGMELSDTTMRHQIGAYTEAQIWLGKVVALPGFRIDADSLASAVRGQPRLTLRWEAAEQTHFKVSGGIYTQEPNTWERLLNPTLPSTTSQQVGFGVEQTIASRLEFQLEAYHKQLGSPLITPPTGPIYATARGRTFGVEFVTRYRIRDVFFLWGWLNYSRSQWDIEDDWLSSHSDQPISGGLVSSWQYSERWTFGLRYRAATGLPYTPVVDSLYNAGADTWHPVIGDLNATRFPFYHRLDLRAATNWSFNEWTLALTLDLILVPPSSTQLYPTWNYDWTQTTWVRGPSILPLFTLRADF